MQTLTHLNTILPSYDALLLDLWGVVHDGTHLYPGAKECLQQLHAANKKIIFVSNAPRRAHKVKAVLGQLGVDASLYLDVVSSGEVGFQMLEQKKLMLGKKYFYIGPAKDEDVLDGLGFESAPLADADFLLNVGFGTEAQSADDFAPNLRAAKERNLPMLCLNPDMEVVKISGERFPCAGVIAKEYEALGGKVILFGKPYPEIYAHCFAVLSGISQNRILAVGDGLFTDILGANRAGIKSVFVKGGIAKGNDVAFHDAKPDYLMEAFTW